MSDEMQARQALKCLPDTQNRARGHGFAYQPMNEFIGLRGGLYE